MTYLTNILKCIMGVSLVGGISFYPINKINDSESVNEQSYTVKDFKGQYGNLRDDIPSRDLPIQTNKSNPFILNLKRGEIYTTKEFESQYGKLRDDFLTKQEEIILK